MGPCEDTQRQQDRLCQTWKSLVVHLPEAGARAKLPPAGSFPCWQQPEVPCTVPATEERGRDSLLTPAPGPAASLGCMQHTWHLLGVLITDHLFTASDELILNSLSCPWGLSSASLTLGLARAGKFRVLGRFVSRVLVSCRVQLSRLKV